MDKTIKYDLDDIRSAAPHIVILELGSNDLCDKDNDPVVHSRFNRAFTQRPEIAIYNCL